MSNPQDPRVTAVRQDRAVGRGSCSSIDECMEDSELLAALDKAKICTPRQAVDWARDREGLALQHATSFREGTDNDPQLQWLAEFEATVAANPNRKD